jgi:hypothetical protein
MSTPASSCEGKALLLVTRTDPSRLHSSVPITARNLRRGAAELLTSENRLARVNFRVARHSTTNAWQVLTLPGTQERFRRIAVAQALSNEEEGG